MAIQTAEFYQKKPTESISEYTARVSASYSPKETTQETPIGTPITEETQPLPTPDTGGRTTDTTRYSRLSPIEQQAQDTLAAPLKSTETVEQIQARKRKEAQAQIDAINQLYATKLEEQARIGQGRERQTSSVSTLTGLAGSTEANIASRQTENLNKREMDAIRAEQNAMIQSILSEVRSSAVEEAQQQRAEARQSAQDVLALRAQRAEKAVNDLSVLSASGVTAEGLKQTDPQSYQYFADQVGGEEMLKGYITLNRPVDQIIDKKIEGGKYIIAYQNPITGATKVETVDLGLPVGYSKTVDAGDRIIAIPDNWDGDPNELITINKGLTPAQAVSTTGGTSEVTGDMNRDAESVMNGTLNLQDISVKDNYRANVAGILTQKFNEAKSKGDIVGTMKASAVYDKEPSDTFLQSFGKVVNVLGQLGVLQENLTNGFEEGNVEGVKTGPIVGAFKSANPWSTEGQVIKAQLNAIVPNLARGVYGEVGVLTDNDIKTYSKTIPNLTSTEDIRNAVLYITVDMIKKSLKSQIDVQAAGQRDMSGFAGIYENLSNQANTILSQISGANIPNESGTTGTLRSPDGTQEVSISDLTPEQIQEAKDAGWQ